MNVTHENVYKSDMYAAYKEALREAARRKPSMSADRAIFFGSHFFSAAGAALAYNTHHDCAFFGLFLDSSSKKNFSCMILHA